MGSGILEVIQQAQYDEKLNRDPEITFFKTVYYRYTHFSKENIIEYFDDDVDWGKEVVCTLSKTGDLVGQIFIEFELDATAVAEIGASSREYMYPDLELYMLKQPIRAVIENLLSKVKAVDLLSYYLPLVQQLELTDFVSEFTNYIDTLEIHSDVAPIPSVFTFNILTVAGISTDTNTLVNLEDAFTNFKVFDVFRLYILMDYVSILQSFNDYYSNQIFDKSILSNLVKQLKTHEYNKLVSQLKPDFIKLFTHFLVEEFYIKIGGDTIDAYDCHLLNIKMQLNKLFETPSYRRLTRQDQLQEGRFTIALPLQFWFNKLNSGALPCVALKYHEIQIGIKTAQTRQILMSSIFYDKIKISSVKLYVDYYYLTNTEKLKFSTSSLEYLILQHQFIVRDVVSPTMSIDLDFFHACKELLWICFIEDGDKFQSDYLIPGTTITPIIESQIFLNNTNLGTVKESIYYSLVKPYQSYSHCPDNGINVFSFALHPEEYQPSGSVNLGEIPTKYLQITLDKRVLNYDGLKQLRLYTTRYNILRISNGFGRLLYE